MREIKFRFWSERLKGMSPPVTLDGLMQSAVLKTLGEGLRDMTPMQYTGLKDKNGVEIYEGDILERDDKIKRLGSSFVVCWKQSQATTGWNVVASDGRQTRSLTISGNIYDNPELLKEPTT